jgi:hypothetical protein
VKLNIRLLYLYLFSFVGLLVTVVGSIQLVNLGLKAYVFPQADEMVVYPTMRPLVVPMEGTKEPPVQVSEEEQKKLDEDMRKAHKDQTKRQHQRDATNAVAMIIIGLPLYVYHWRLAQKEKA